MRTKLAILVLASAAASGCSYTPHDLPDRGLASVNVPVVTSADYVFDASAPGGAARSGRGRAPQRLVPGPRPRLRRHGLCRRRLCRPRPGAGRGGSPARYGMVVTPGAPVTAGVVSGDSVRVVVSRRRAEVPGCPNWSVPSQPNFNNRSMSNFGCGVNSNLAAMVANPEDLLHGREALRNDRRPLRRPRPSPSTGLLRRRARRGCRTSAPRRIRK